MLLALQRYWFRRRADPRLVTRWRTPLTTDALLAVDLETSSLSSADGDIVSAAWVAIDGQEVVLSSARHWVLRPNRSVGQSAQFHGIRDCDRGGGATLEQVMSSFLEAADGRRLLFHGGALDRDFLNSASRRLFNAPLLLPAIDTLELEKTKLTRHQDSLETGALRLATCRRRYGLPDYPAHHALNDAIATAELYLAIASRRG